MRRSARTPGARCCSTRRRNVGCAVSGDTCPVRRDAIVDKFVGDEVIAIFVPAMAGPNHARIAVTAAIELLQRTGHDAGRPWLPIGAGVNTGVAYVGAIGEGPDTELTAMGDTVNTTARLASSAGAVSCSSPPRRHAAQGSSLRQPNAARCR